MLGACAATPTALPSATPSADTVIVPSRLSAGTVELRVRTMYALGDPVVIGATVRASGGSIRGPIRARIVASGIGGELPVRDLAAGAIEVPDGARGQLELVWDGRDGRGTMIPDDYGLVLDFVSTTATGSRTEQATATLQVR